MRTDENHDRIVVKKGRGLADAQPRLVQARDRNFGATPQERGVEGSSKGSIREKGEGP